MQYFEDFPVGTRGALGPRRIEAAEMIAYAEEFDPQPFHLDEAAGRASILGGLAASGWFTSAVLMRMIFDAYLHDAAGLGSPGIDEIKWTKPVLAGDTLAGHYEVVEARTSGSRPGIGILRVVYELQNQRGEAVIRWDCVQFMRTRPAATHSDGTVAA